jgi:hypothetical protein
VDLLLLLFSSRELLGKLFSRKGAKKTLRNAAALCAFAALRESSSPKEVWPRTVR